VKYVLDTNVVSALMRGDARVLGRLEKVPKADVSIPQPVFAEIAFGLERLPRSKRRERLARKCDQIREEIGRCPWTDAVSDAFGEIKSALERRGELIEDFDIAIAAHALANDAVLVSANVTHMSRAPGVTVEDWAQAE
jgi:tRNA(fMet)-specific endonuclease VapC